MRNFEKRIFDNINKSGIDAILNGLGSHGSVVTGNNPWNVDTRQHGVRLRGDWIEETSQLTITVIDAGWYVPSKKIWENIQSLILLVQEATWV
jgi:hypothetical protein